MADSTTKLVHLVSTWSAAAEVTFEGNVFGLAESVQYVATAVLMNVEGMPPGSHIFSSTLRSIRIADKSEMALGGESGT